MTSRVCRYVNLSTALSSFVNSDEHRGSEHIIGLHWYLASRLVLEGGFHPDTIVPHPLFKVSNRKGQSVLEYDQNVGGSGESTILGGLKTKKVDIVVAHEGIGPCLAVSVKGTQRAVRNLTNRLEEAVGDCTNLHISYPALVYGFLHVIQANEEGLAPSHWKHKKAENNTLLPNDVVVRSDGRIALALTSYHDALSRLADRFDMRDDPSRYEAVSLLFASTRESTIGRIYEDYPAPDSALRFDGYFRKLYTCYDRRFVYSARTIARKTRRLFWSPDSPAFDACAIDYQPRVESDHDAGDIEDELGDFDD